MPASPYVLGLRERIGSGLLLLPSVTCLVFDDEGGVLLVEHGDTGHWVAPGGSIEPGETPADAAARELWEETGLESVPRRILGVFGGADFVVRYRNGDEVAYVMTVFECEVTGGELRPDGEEVRQTRFFGARDLPEGFVELGPAGAPRRHAGTPDGVLRAGAVVRTTGESVATPQHALVVGPGRSEGTHNPRGERGAPSAGAPRPHVRRRSTLRRPVLDRDRTRTSRP